MTLWIECVSNYNIFSHKDKNQDNVEECARIFHSLQHAYEVLSDPHERAW